MPEFCKTCRAEVRWVRMRKSGKLNPLDVLPNSEQGNVVIGSDGQAEMLKRVELERARADGTVLYVSHWATCVDREAWRERTDAKRAREQADGVG